MEWNGVFRVSVSVTSSDECAYLKGAPREPRHAWYFSFPLAKGHTVNAPDKHIHSTVIEKITSYCIQHFFERPEGPINWSFDS